jgi:hypothetical protein
VQLQFGAQGEDAGGGEGGVGHGGRSLKRKEQPGLLFLCHGGD